MELIKLLFRKDDVMKVNRYIVIALNEKGEIQQDYIQALNAKQAVSFLYSGKMDEVEILDVAKCLKHWEKA